MATPRPRRSFGRPDGAGRPPARRGGGERYERRGGPGGGDRNERRGGPGGGDRYERRGRPGGGDRFERRGGPGGGDRFERRGGPGGGDRFERDGAPRERRYRPDSNGRPSGRFDRAGRNNRFDRGGRSDRTDRGGRPAPRYGRPTPDLHREPEAESLTPPEYNDLVWGLHASQAILESERPIHRIWCTPELRFRSRFLQLLREAKSSGVLVEEVTWARLAQLSGGAVHQGIVLQTAAAQTHDLETLIDSCAGLGEAPLLMAVDGLTDPHNLGAIVRSAEALGAHGLVLPQRRSAGLTGSVAKVAAGALEHLPVARVVNLNRSLERLKDAGYRVVGLAEEGSATLAEADLDGPLVVVTGSEGQGLSMLTRRHCDQLVRIPLRGVTPSLNASVATALLLYEVARRNWMGALKGTDPAPRLQRLQLQGQQAQEIAAEVPAESAPAADLPAALDGDIRL